mmetsp:Transcript_53262/g.124808  ORF Transcript_53262/g.124808 Transcript_53262/m.124808 type:complete len:209 (-) Transcript_53262:144-770(-)
MAPGRVGGQLSHGTTVMLTRQRGQEEPGAAPQVGILNRLASRIQFKPVRGQLHQIAQRHAVQANAYTVLQLDEGRELDHGLQEVVLSQACRPCSRQIRRDVVGQFNSRQLRVNRGGRRSRHAGRCHRGDQRWPQWHLRAGADIGRRCGGRHGGGGLGSGRSGPQRGRRQRAAALREAHPFAAADGQKRLRGEPRALRLGFEHPAQAIT